MNTRTLLESQRLLTVKTTWSVFQSISGIERLGQHCNCPLHSDRNGSMSVWQGEEGIFWWKCHAGCGHGSVIDFAALAWKTSIPETIRRLLDENSSLPATKFAPAEKKVREHPRPIPDTPKINEFLFQAQLNLLSDFDFQEKWMRGNRGLSLEICRILGLGWMKSCFGKENCWIIPCKDEWDVVLALKIHSETAPKGRKCMYAPFGLNGRHAWSTLWPGRESGFFAERAAILEIDCGYTREQAERLAGAECDPVVLCPGELKAATWLDAGKDALAITGGESFRWTPETIKRLQYRRVHLDYDDDEAGALFRDNTIEALYPHCLSITHATFGKKESI